VLYAKQIAGTRKGQFVHFPACSSHPKLLKHREMFCRALDAHLPPPDICHACPDIFISCSILPPFVQLSCLSSLEKIIIIIKKCKHNKSSWFMVFSTDSRSTGNAGDA